MRVDKSQRYRDWIFVETPKKTLYFPKGSAQELRDALSYAGGGGSANWDSSAFKVNRDLQQMGEKTVILTSKDHDAPAEVWISCTTAREIAQELDNLALREAQIQKGYDRLKGKSS